MAGANVSSEPMQLTDNQLSSSQLLFSLVTLTTLFFMWGFITCLNDILIPYLKAAFDLTYTQAMLIQFCFFGAYFVISVPAGKLVEKIGYQKGIVTGLALAGVGCLIFYPAASVGVYGVFLGALFVLASGITILQVSANPYVSILGKPETASSRLTLTQAFNSLGTTLAPFFGAWLLFGGSHGGEGETVDALAVQFPYLLLAGTLFVLAVVFFFLNLPKVERQTSAEAASSAWHSKHLRLGTVAIFLYVGAEVAIGSFLINFFALEHIANMSAAQAGNYIAYYWGGALVGRFIGAIVMQKVAANKVLAVNATVSVLLIVVSVFSQGELAFWAILAVGLFNSIMFPTIFSLAITKLGNSTSQGSGLLCLAIVGGAIVPLVQGVLADNIGVQLAFLLPAACYLFILYYGLKGFEVEVAEKQEAA